MKSWEWQRGTRGKFTNYEWAPHSPLIIRMPGIPRPGVAVRGIVETIDVYPTLADLCGLAASDDLPGSSLRPLLVDPDHPGKNGALSAIYRSKHVMGYTLRTDRYRCVDWDDTETGTTKLLELYDHRSDPLETENIASSKPEVVEQLLKQIRNGKTYLQPNPAK